MYMFSFIKVFGVQFEKIEGFASSISKSRKLEQELVEPGDAPRIGFGLG